VLTPHTPLIAMSDTKRIISSLVAFQKGSKKVGVDNCCAKLKAFFAKKNITNVNEPYKIDR